MIWFKRTSFIFLVLLASISIHAHAADDSTTGSLGDGSTQSMDDNTTDTAPSQETKTIPAKSTHKVTAREKETDGTTAANRFEADTVIKSQYKLDGEQLEVDPD